MRLGGTEAYTEEGIVFSVLFAYGPRSDHQENVDRIETELAETLHGILSEHERGTGEDEPSQISVREATGAIDRAMRASKAAINVAARELMGKLIVRVDGVVDAAGEPITEWSADLEKELPEPLVMRLYERIVKSASDVRLERDARDGGPGNAVSAPSSQPSDTTPEAE